MMNRSLRHWFRLGVVTTAAVAALSARADLRGQSQDDHRREPHGAQLPTGQYVTPDFVKGAVQQYLNPGLAAYPDFVAGEAVRSHLSPDGATLAILTAGQNSLYKPD